MHLLSNDSHFICILKCRFFKIYVVLNENKFLFVLMFHRLRESLYSEREKELSLRKEKDSRKSQRDELTKKILAMKERYNEKFAHLKVGIVYCLHCALVGSVLSNGHKTTLDKGK